VVYFTLQPLYFREGNPVSTEQEGIWAPQWVGTFEKKVSARIRTPDGPAGSPVTTQTTSFQLPRKVIIIIIIIIIYCN